MRPFRFLAAAMAACLTGVLMAQTAPPQPPTGQTPPQTQQPDVIEITIGPGGRPPRLAVPEFIALTADAETVKAARTIGQVLFDDIEYEKEFYMVPRDILKTVPQPPSAEGVQLDRWKEIGADGVIIGTVRRSGDGVVVEARLLQVGTGKLALGKQYSGSVKSLADGGRLYAHTFADELHKQQRGLRGVARTKLAFSSNRTGEKLGGPVKSRDVSNIYMVDYDGANERRLTVYQTLEISPVWSPDGRAIAYTSYRNSYPDIFISYIYEGKLERPAKGTSETKNYLPAWSHDGTRIAYTSALPDGNVEIFIMNRDGSGARRVTNHPMGDVTPTWSPSGTQLAFVSDRTGSPQIYVVDVDGTGLRRISTESYCDRPTWSAPPLNEIAYTCRGGGGYQIMLYDFATGTSKPISDGIGSNESPAFAPNGRHIAFVSDRTGRQQVYTMHRDGTGLRQITRTGTNKYPNWSQ
jgi:TolB protein